MNTDQQRASNDTGLDPDAAAPCVLLVGENAAALQALDALVRTNVPKARIETLGSTTELVFRLATDDVAIVLIDCACLCDLPPGLLGLSRRLSGFPRVALVGEPGAAAPAICPPDLPAWLRLAVAQTQKPALLQPQPRPPHPFRIFGRHGHAAGSFTVNAALAAFAFQPDAAPAALGDFECPS